MRFLSASLATLGLGLALACSAPSPASQRAPAADAGPVDDDRPLVPASKIDLLIVVDDSASMADKTAILGNSLQTLLRGMAAAVSDIHVGVVTSSLGTPGGNVCDSTGNPSLNTLAHLQRTAPDGAPVAGADNGVLAFTGSGADDFIARAQELVRGVGERGCGFEAQLEAAYRFLVQPDPWATSKLDDQNRLSLDGVDAQVLVERKAFLRPDSALVVLLLTDEDDSFADPLEIGGQGWAFMNRNFPSSKVQRTLTGTGTTAPRGTAICTTNPASPRCTSCGFGVACNVGKPNCDALRADAYCAVSSDGETGEGVAGFYGGSDDSLNVRFHRMKKRFGVDPQFPIARYVDGFTRPTVPDRSTEHKPISTAPPDPEADLVFENTRSYLGTPKCTNPIFAATLPSSASEELCQLPRGPRSRGLVFFALVGGVPERLVSDLPDWTKIVGVDPDAYDETGMDPHMIPSMTPRPGLAPPSAPGDNGSDPIHGREWETGKNDLQYACTFDLTAPRICERGDTSCDCEPGRTEVPPLCNGDQQIKAKAYPAIRPLRVVRGLGERGVFGSICSQSYESTMTRLLTRVTPKLAKK